MHEVCLHFDEALEKECDRVLTSHKITMESCDILRFIFTVTVIILICKRRQFCKIPWLARLTLMGLLLQAVLFPIINESELWLFRGRVGFVL